jgi:CAAX prenyl protease-like protein
MLDRVSLPRIAPFFAYLFFIFVGDMLGRMGFTAGQLRYLYLVKIATVLVILIVYRKHYVELAWQALPVRTIVTAVATGLLALVLWVNLNAGWMTIGASAGFDPRGPTGAIDWTLVVVRIAGAALVVPVMEELFWRSFLMRWMEAPDFLKVPPGDVKCKSFVVTVILFGLEHNLWLAGIVAGAAYSVLYMRSRTLWSPVLAHGVTNGLLGVWIIATGQWTYW